MSSVYPTPLPAPHLSAPPHPPSPTSPGTGRWPLVARTIQVQHLQRRSSFVCGMPISFPWLDNCSWGAVSWGVLGSVLGSSRWAKAQEGSWLHPCPWKAQGQRAWGALASAPSSEPLLKSSAACSGPCGLQRPEGPLHEGQAGSSLCSLPSGGRGWGSAPS